MAQIYKTAMGDAERFRYEEQLAAKDAEIERLNRELDSVYEGREIAQATAEQEAKANEALNAFVAAFDKYKTQITSRTQAANFTWTDLLEARAALEE